MTTRPGYIRHVIVYSGQDKIGEGICIDYLKGKKNKWVQEVILADKDGNPMKAGWLELGISKMIMLAVIGEGVH